MTLQNLLAIQRLQAHRAEREAAMKLLRAARRNLALHQPAWKEARA